MLSDNNKRNLLQTALVAEYGLTSEMPKPDKIAVEEVFDDRIIYSIDGQLYEATYEMDGETPKIGEPRKVTATKLFYATESLQTAYSELIQEAGKRNALKDAKRVKAILALCQELLSTEPDEEKATKAMKEAQDVLALLKLEEATKTEDGVAFPSQAYAYTPDLDTPSTWKLRLWQDIENKVTRRQLGLAAAALSPGGFRGQRVQIPTTDLSAVKRKIRSAYRTLGVDEEDIPRWVKETETRELLRSYVPLTEAKFDKGRATIIVIKPGFNSDESRYYPAEMLKRDFKVFEGQKMFANHPTEQEDKDRPERSMGNSWVAVLKDVSVDESGVVTGVAEIVEPWLMAKLATLRDKKMLSEMGISINAVGNASKATIDGKETLVIETLVAARSVDFVTEPGAGGIVTFYESNRNSDIDLVDISTLKTARPDLVKTIEDGVKAQLTKEVKKAMENEALIKEKDEEIASLTTERDALKEAAEKAEKATAKAEAQATIKEAVDKAELPDAAKERLIERFKDAENAAEIVEAIESEVAYIAKLSEAGKVTGLGPSHANPDKGKESLKESFKRTNPEWTAEQLETAVNGR